MYYAMVEKGKVVVCQRCNAQLTNASDAELWEKEYLSKGIAKEKKVTCASCNYFTRLILITDRKFKDMDKINFFIRLRSAQSLIGYPSGPAGNAIFSVLVKKIPATWGEAIDILQDNDKELTRYLEDEDIIWGNSQEEGQVYANNPLAPEIIEIEGHSSLLHRSRRGGKL